MKPTKCLALDTWAGRRYHAVEVVATRQVTPAMIGAAHAMPGESCPLVDWWEVKP